ncbi:transcriptional regulator [bacterium]|nr:MAG: transcriptional regulator [bacterium]
MGWESKKEGQCPVEVTLGYISGRWKVMILYYLFGSERRFNELTRLLKGISARTLTNQLREMEEDGIIQRHVYAQVPPKVVYSLTELGRSLKPVLIAMSQWGRARSVAVDATSNADLNAIVNVEEEPSVRRADLDGTSEDA